MEQVVAACPEDRCARRLQAKINMVDVLGFAIGALYMVGIHDRHSDSTYAKARKWPQAVFH